MQRLALLALLAACSSPARAPISNAAAATRFTLQPIQVFGDEGRHGARHTTTMIAGALELRGAQATLTLDFDTAVSYVRCPSTMLGVTRQQCADESLRDSRAQTRKVFSGAIAVKGAGFSARLRNGAEHVRLTCNETSLGYSCDFDDEHSIWAGYSANRPRRLELARPTGRLVYELAPTTIRGPSADIQVAGTLEVAATQATLSLAVDGAPAKTVRLPVLRAPVGLVFRGSGVAMICQLDNDALDCMFDAEAGVFSQSWASGNTRLVMRR